jgi:preprotein translocase subunit SecA
MFKTMQAKYRAIAQDIKQRHELGQPVLVGTIAIETSELLSNLLSKMGIRHDVLNAKQHEREAEIIKHAGEKGSVTIATNMAGRGTDIKLGEGVKELGGLAVIGTERHEARRIDNQLRGRSGRQGDPGYSRFYLSSEDELLVRFGSDRFKNALGLVVTTDANGNETPLESKMFSRFVESAQRKIEGNNFDRRKSVVEYDEVLRKQREIIYKQRNDILFLDDVEPIVLKMFASVSRRKASSHIVGEGRKETVDAKEMLLDIYARIFNVSDFTVDDFANMTSEEAASLLEERLIRNLNQKKEAVPPEAFREFLKVVLLRVVDEHWMDHLDQMSELRQSIGLQAYAQVNPLRQYQEIGYEAFQTMIENIEEQSVALINRALVRDNLQREEVAKISGTNDGQDDTKKKAPVKAGVKVGRNDPCPCGSGQKYKYCCGK